MLKLPLQRYLTLLIAICCLSNLQGLVAQDIHFSQFDLAPMNYNPALAGQFDGDYRFIGNQRTQWRSVTTPYSTIGGSADARNFMGVEGLGTGVSIYRDIAGDSKLQTVQMNFAGSMIKPISSDSLQTLSGGIHLGFTHKNIDYSALEFDNQWNGVYYDPNAAIGEDFGRDARTYINVNAGLAYFYKISDRREITAGASIFNITKPKESFFNDDQVRLNRRVVLHANGIYKINREWDVQPSIMFQSQGKLREFLLGASARYILMDEGGFFRTVFAGFYGRTRDAGFLVAGMDYDQWRVGISYDINLSDLQPASNSRGGFEISVVYIIRKLQTPDIKYKYCPDFM